jgi:hypothetical protein
MVTIFPKGTLTTFPGIVLLARSPGDQLDQIGNLVLSSPVPDDDVDMLCEAPTYVKFSTPLL